MQLVLGTAQLAAHYGVMSVEGASDTRAIAVLDEARRLGIEAVDTASAYTGAEEAIGKAGAAFSVHTKLPRGEEPLAAFEASLRRLRREQVEVLYLRSATALSGAQDSQLALAETLVGAGAETIGLSVYERWQFLAAVKNPRIAVVQVPMNVFDAAITDGDLLFAARNDTRVIVRSVLLQGLLGDPAQAHGRVPALDTALAAFHGICLNVGRAPIELAIGWVLSRPGINAVVLGAETPKQLEDLVRAFSAPPLTNDVLMLLASIPAPPNGAADPRRWSRV